MSEPPSPARRAVPRAEVRIRDPFILPLPDRGAYLMTGTTGAHDGGLGFDAWTSPDLERWDGPFALFRPPTGFWATRDFWAPEIHPWRGRWLMLATFAAEPRRRGTQALIADDPLGPYRPLGDGPLTPAAHEALDGTLHVDDAGQAWLVYCHEWLQIGDGALRAIRIADDGAGAVGESELLFRASSAGWPSEVRWSDGTAGLVTDGPWLHRAADGALLMLWSSFRGGSYALGVARSTGGVLGPWFHAPAPLVGDDGGHGMLFRVFDGALRLALHRPNAAPRERPAFLPVRETTHGLELA